MNTHISRTLKITIAKDVIDTWKAAGVVEGDMATKALDLLLAMDQIQQATELPRWGLIAWAYPPDSLDANTIDALKTGNSPVPYEDLVAFQLGKLQLTFAGASGQALTDEHMQGNIAALKPIAAGIAAGSIDWNDVPPEQAAAWADLPSGLQEQLWSCGDPAAIESSDRLSYQHQVVVGIDASGINYLRDDGLLVLRDDKNNPVFVQVIESKNYGKADLAEFFGSIAQNSLNTAITYGHVDSARLSLPTGLDATAWKDNELSAEYGFRIPGMPDWLVAGAFPDGTPGATMQGIVAEMEAMDSVSVNHQQVKFYKGDGTRLEDFNGVTPEDTSARTDVQVQVGKDGVTCPFTVSIYPNHAPDRLIGVVLNGVKTYFSSTGEFLDNMVTILDQMRQYGTRLESFTIGEVGGAPAIMFQAMVNTDDGSIDVEGNFPIAGTLSGTFSITSSTGFGTYDSFTEYLDSIAPILVKTTEFTAAFHDRRIGGGYNQIAGTDIKPVESAGDIQVYAVSIPEFTRPDNRGLDSIDRPGAVSLPIECELDCASGTVMIYACEPDGTPHEIASSISLDSLGKYIDGLMAFGQHYKTDLIIGAGEASGDQHGFFLSSFVVESDGTVAFALGFKRAANQASDFDISGHVDLATACTSSSDDWLKAVSFDTYDGQPVTWAELQAMVGMFKEVDSFDSHLPTIGSSSLTNSFTFGKCDFFKGRYFTMEVHLSLGKHGGAGGDYFTLSADMQDEYNVVQLEIPGQEQEAWPVVGNVALWTQALLAGWCNPENAASSTNYIDPASWKTTYDADNHLEKFSANLGTGPEDNLGTVTGFLDFATDIVSITSCPDNFVGFPQASEAEPVQVGSFLAFLELYKHQGHIVYQGSGGASELENGVVVPYFILRVTSNGEPADIYINLQTGLVGVGGPGIYFCITTVLTAARPAFRYG